MYKYFFLVFTEMSYRRKMTELSDFELRNPFNYVVKTKTIALFENFLFIPSYHYCPSEYED